MGDPLIYMNVSGVMTGYTLDTLKTMLISDKVVDRLDALENGQADSNESMDTAWIIFSATLVFLMQAGFTLLEVGSVRIKNTKNILVKNIMDACCAGIVFYLIGYAFALGDGNSFIGWKGFAMQSGFIKDFDVPASGVQYHGNSYAMWVFQFAFAATASTIVSGAVAERTNLVAYFVYTFVLTAFVYPVVVHWGWSSTGWASAFNGEKLLFDVGVIDFAGSTVVHMVGGTSALIGAVCLGPRQGRFGKNKKEMHKQNTVFQVLGTMLLWFGWYGFNAGSTLGISGGLADVAGKTAATTTIAAASSGLVVVILGRIAEGHFDPALCCNGILAGLVSITAGCSVIEPELSFVTGLIGGFIYYGASRMLIWMKIDDVVDASPVHLFCGIWGTLAAGLFAHPKNYDAAYGAVSCGLVYTAGCEGTGGKQLAANLVFILAVIGWVVATVGPLFIILRVTGLLRVTQSDEITGLDKVEHGGGAYENALRRISTLTGPPVIPNIVLANKGNEMTAVGEVSEPSSDTEDERNHKMSLQDLE